MLTESEINAYTVDIPNDIQASLRASGSLQPDGSASASKPQINMNEDQAYGKLQELLSIAETLKDSGHYTAEEILDEIKTRIGE